ncbi:MAG: DUF1428 domain-containing protein [Alphaproteobacteria bacterium]|nr:DUF1428 domain-containing protein [Alphaproteobacteria bacterium]HPF45324.1 DUF1428 domain-containing protein [Emcibacteraceae bacterium]HRW29851.1 DUF1428 domain-containing protein [Emcibacteraceae bacterium]
MKYIDGFLLPVPNARKDDYLVLAKKMAEIYIRRGALSIHECWGNDVPEGKLTSMPKAVLKEPDETVVFSWVVWPDKETRDKVHDLLVEDMHNEMADTLIPFDGKRMILGGFDMILDK